MPDSRDQFTIPVDVTNPGQFYACCGLLELATAVDSHATGRFVDADFVVESQADPRELVRDADVTIDMPSRTLNRMSELRRIKGIRKRGSTDAELNQLKAFEATEREAAVWIMLGETRLNVGWWRHGPSGEVKTWAGGQVTVGAVQAMHKAVMPLLNADVPFNEAAPVDAKPFYFDCRSGGDAVDQGFSFDEVKNVDVLAYPVVEFLAFVGLTRFRPGGNERRVKRYATWCVPLPTTLAAPVATGLLPDLSAGQYRFRLHPRDASFRYKSFGRAEPVEQLENQR
jgi:CRISPR-associated protein Csb3